MTNAELEHALNLLREVKGWSGPVSVVEIDASCGFRPAGEPRCGQRLGRAIVLLADSPLVHVLAVCDHHARVMQRAVERWRRMA